MARQIRQNRQAMAELAASMTCDNGDFTEYAQLRRSCREREGDLSRSPRDIPAGRRRPGRWRGCAPVTSSACRAAAGRAWP